MSAPWRRRRSRFHRRLGFLALALLCAYWLLAIGATYVATGLFSQVGIDFGMFWAATRSLFAAGPGAAYDLGSVAQQLSTLGAYYHAGAGPLAVGGAPYPPVAFLLVWPFTLLSPPVGFALWTGFNAALVLAVIVPLARRLPQRSWMLVPTTFVSLPVMDSLFVGQFVSIFAFALYRAVVAWERHDEFRAGLWLSVLLLKPQLAFAFALVLLLKRRWFSIAGFVTGGVALAASSLLLLGRVGVWSLFRLVAGGFAGYADVDRAADPARMISWRGELVRWMPGVEGAAGLALVLVLSLATLAVLPLLWRGRWQPGSPRFSLQLLGTVIVTLLAGYHMHLHSAMLLVVPGLLLWTQPELTRTLRLAMLAGVYLPAVINVVALSLGLGSRLHLDFFVLLLAGGLVATLYAVRAVEVEVSHPREVARASI